MVHLAGGVGGQSYLYRGTDRVNAETYETAPYTTPIHKMADWNISCVLPFN